MMDRVGPLFPSDDQLCQLCMQPSEQEDGDEWIALVGGIFIPIFIVITEQQPPPLCPKTVIPTQTQTPKT